MNWKDIYGYIKQIENGENKDVVFLYELGCLNLQKLYYECADFLYEAEKYNYPKKKLDNIEKRIYQHSPLFFESYLNKKYSATFNGHKLV